jgi:hypothetical protein
MRTLTIKREKKFAACLGKDKVYIEDHQTGELVIGGVPCRKLGTLKNGETASFAIDNDAAKVFVIGDKLSRNMCNDFYQLPEGQEEVFLVGRNRYNPLNWNAFRFDNNNSPEVLKNRKKGTRKGLLIVLVAFVLGFVVAFFGAWQLWESIESQPTTFSSGGMSIVLPDDFTQIQLEDYDVAYESEDVLVLALEEKFDLFDGLEDYTPEKYINLIVKTNKLQSVRKVVVDGVVGFEYMVTDEQAKQSYVYSSYVYKTDDSFWLVQFGVKKEKIQEYVGVLPEWIQSVSFE